MAQTLIQGINQISIDDAECRGGLSIYLGQGEHTVAGDAVPDQTRWHFEVWADIGDGLLFVGKFDTAPPTAPPGNSPRTRLVATAAVPGAFSFTVRVTPAAGDPDSNAHYAGEVSLSAGDPGGQLPGVQRVGERPGYVAGGGGGVVTLQAGQRLLAWSAFSTGAGATVQIDRLFPTIAGQPISIPPGGAVQGGDGGLYEGPLQLTFAGGAMGGYLVEYAESA